jgi:2-dehydro-3-deoxy-D-arabinonate dehydratase
MKLVQFSAPDVGVRLGMIEGDTVIDITNSAEGLGSVLNALECAERENTELEQIVRANVKPGKKYLFRDLDVPPEPERPHLLLPVFPPEVWGCGVTYRRSADAREDEVKGQGGFYDMAYRAERPEVFFKASPSRCTGPNGPVGLRSDSRYMAPEPELAILLDRMGRIHGFTCANDMSAWDIERENPLYLPQSKTFAACCCLGPCIVTSEHLPEPKNVKVTCTVTRGKKVLFSGETNTSQMKRELDELIGFLTRSNPIPTGTILMTGTGIIMPEEVKLEPGDWVTITMEHIGTLRNFAKLV